jgi:DNA-binding transcriptional ArsR family regulator
MTTVYDPERVVVEEILWRANGRLRTDLYGALKMLSREEVDRAIASLTKHGLVRTTTTRVLPTSALRHIEYLNLIAV